MVRVKRRYFTLQINTDNPKTELLFSERDLVMALREAVQGIHGDFGLGSLIKSLTVKRLSTQTRTALVGCQRGSHELLSTSIPFVRKIKQTECSLQVVYLSGTIRSSLKFLIAKFGRENKQFAQQLKEDVYKRKTKTEDEAASASKKNRLEVEEESPD